MERKLVWNTVGIVAPEGYSFGLTHDRDGMLGIAVRPPGGEWPHGTGEIVDAVNTIGVGAKAYLVKGGVE